MTAKEQISGVYRAIMEDEGRTAAERLGDLLAADGKELRKCGADLYMLLRFAVESGLFEGAEEQIAKAMDRIALYSVSLEGTQHLIEIRNNDNLDIGIFVDSIDKLEKPWSVVERKYITDDYLHFIERIYRDVNGLKYRSIELPPPPMNYTSGYDLQNGFLMEREENLKLMLEEDE